MDLFEQSKLKGQRLNISTLLAKPEFKQQYFAPIRRLNESEQCCLLTKVHTYPIDIFMLRLSITFIVYDAMYD